MQNNTSGPKRIIYVDTDDDYGTFVVTVLKRFGHSAMLLRRPAEVLGLLEQQAASWDALITSDVLLAWSGVELAELITRRYPRIRCLVVSGDPVASSGSAATGPLLAKPDSLEGVANLLARLDMPQAAQRE
jgi:DNA-binding NtrC family response regulator